ncbi:MAG: glycosyltransferase family 2 protein [Betaproteobacteria bacterium]
MAAAFASIAVVIPCYRVKEQVLAVIADIGAEVQRIYVVDDACPQATGRFVREQCRDARLTVIIHDRNRGVGAAVVSGYRAALADGADVIVKIDGDGQMDPACLPQIAGPVAAGVADYAKGNRFYDFELLDEMPRLRLVGNAIVSLVSKIASGYWDVMDPTNGYTAVHRAALQRLPLDKLDSRYFFESDMLFRLYTIRAVVQDVPLPSRYRGEPSSLSLPRAALAFPVKYARATVKRIFYAYFLRDFNAGTLLLVLGGVLAGAGAAFGAWEWHRSIVSGVPTTSGTVMLAALPVLAGLQLLLSALQFDIQNVPRIPLQQLDAQRALPRGVAAEVTRRSA